MITLLRAVRDAIAPSLSKDLPPPSTIDNVLHRLWSDRVGAPGYDKDEKQLWMALQNFVNRKGGRTARFEDYRA